MNSEDGQVYSVYCNFLVLQSTTLCSQNINKSDLKFLRTFKEWENSQSRKKIDKNHMVSIFLSMYFKSATYRETEINQKYDLKTSRMRKVAKSQKKTLKLNGLIFSMWYKSATAEINHNELKVFKNFWTMKKYKITKK